MQKEEGEIEAPFERNGDGDTEWTKEEMKKVQILYR